MHYFNNCNTLLGPYYVKAAIPTNYYPIYVLRTALKYGYNNHLQKMPNYSRPIMSQKIRYIFNALFHSIRTKKK